MTDNPDRLARRLHRLRYETMDWCRHVQGEQGDRLAAHRQPINGDPEAWDDV